MAVRIRVRGQVQGVGFRPFVWQLARAHALSGHVLNDPEGVLIVADRAPEAFLRALGAEAPPLARIDAVEIAETDEPVPGGAFTIAASRGQGSETRVTPDAATCPACAAEIREPGRRQGYAFTNCTHCGPRFTILRGLPYDRARTTMARFALCPACRAEYGDPGDRRFHAQPIACPDCGPRLWLERGGVPVPGDAIALAAAQLRAGGILAVKGLGGFHLACDATDPGAVALLRSRKRRPSKPLAVMAPLALLRRIAALAPADEALLADPAAPVVLVPAGAQPLPAAIAPGMTCLGVMLPYTPLHHLLCDAVGRPLVMTSGNLSGEPQVIDDDEARERLAAVVDGILMHDRAIARRLDDSVERARPPMVLRRARGRVPATLPLPPGFADAPPVLAYGAEMKAAICLTKTGQALLSHHLGELDEPRSWAEFLKAETDYAQLFDHRPGLLACDLHPGYRATAHAEAQAAARGLPLVRVQHHHAHLAACLGENLWPLDAALGGGPVAGIILDGTGFGADGTVWGGELLLGDYRAVTREGFLVPAPLPGGAAAAREPWRNAVMRLDAAGRGDLAERLFAGKPLAALRQAARAGINAPPSSSAGRLYDAVAAMLGLCPDRQGYEGEAAMRLEALAGAAAAPPCAFGAGLDPAPMIRALARDIDAGRPRAEIAAAFQSGLAAAFAAAARALVESGRARAVALSGGCFQNAGLLGATLAALDGLPVLVHSRTPANDGGLALGQALVAAAGTLPESG
ncbi:carbamoyltransferase HypF [Frigidibacter sp. MR17.24]|uniref:carbamoyltransferase HypF n=1 Tax=Frigidibacter sp. MR17.24 TaxID=3127345 RepID=UPI003012D11E